MEDTNISLLIFGNLKILNSPADGHPHKDIWGLDVTLITIHSLPAWSWKQPVKNEVHW
jgi:hypothetical protein